MSSLFSPFRVMLLFAAMAVVSWCFVGRVPVELHARQTAAVLEISYELRNADPKTVESSITQVIESACSSIPQLKKMQSVSNYGEGSIQLSFAPQADLALKRLEVAAAVRRIQSRLPVGAGYPQIGQDIGRDEDHSPLLIYTITGSPGEDPASVKETCDAVFKKQINALPGVKEMLLTGAPEKQVMVYLDLERCRAWGVKTGQIKEVLKNLDLDRFPGTVKIDSANTLFVHVQNEALSLSALKNILIPAGKSSIPLSELARVTIEDQPIQSFTRVNGKDAITLLVFARKGENKLALSGKLRQRVALLSGQLPARYQVRLAVDDTAFLRQEMQKNIQRTTWSVAILLLFLLIVYRNWRLLVCLTMSLFISLSLALLIMLLTRVALDMYTLAALVVSFGMMMDNSIVMLDYFHRFRSKKIITAVLAATGTTAAVVGLIFFLPEEQKAAVGNFAMVVIISLMASVISALFFLPGIYQILIRRNGHIIAQTAATAKGRFGQALKAAYGSFIALLLRFRMAFFTVLVLVFGLPFFLLPVARPGNHWYNGLYQSTFGSNRYQQDIRPYADGWLGGTFKRFVDNISEHSGYRPPEKIRLYLSAQLPYGTSTGQLNGIIGAVEQYLLGFPEIASFVSNVYSGQQAGIEIIFNENYEHSAFPFQLKEKLIHRTAELGGVDWLVYGIGQGFNNNGGGELPDYRIVLKGYNYQQLQEEGKWLAAQLATNRRIQDINIDERFDNTEKLSANYLLTMNPERLSLYKASQREVLRAVDDRARAGAPATMVAFAGHYYPLVVQASGANQFSAFDLLHTALYLDSGQALSLQSNAHMDYRVMPNVIHKEDRQYIRIVSFHYTGSLLAAKSFISNQVAQANAGMPAGYSAELKDTTLQWKAKVSNTVLLLALLGVIYLVCAVLFENLRQPLYIIILIPVSFIGLFLVFAQSGSYFDQGGYCAFLMTGGLVANGAIFIVNDINHARAGMVDKPAIMLDIIIKRSRTILLSTISTCCGLVPFIFGEVNEVFWYSFAIGTVAGLIFSLASLFVVLPLLLWRRPVAY